MIIKCKISSNLTKRY